MAESKTIWKFNIKNSPGQQLSCCVDAYNFLTSGVYGELDVINNLRIHSTGNLIYQRWVKGKQVTIYPYLDLAVKFLGKDKNRAEKFIHFINGDKTDLRIANMMLITVSQKNMLFTNTSSASGHKGLILRDSGHYEVRVYNGEKNLYFGTYASRDEAIAVWEKAFNEHSPVAELAAKMTVGHPKKKEPKKAKTEE